jgi:hypothetical protein
MNSECLRIADQLSRAFTGKPWHGSPVRELLAGITAEQACDRPLSSAHSIWELVLHIEIYVQAAVGVVEGVPMPKISETPADWRPVLDARPTAWSATTERLFERADRLTKGIEGFTDERLTETVPGREYDFYYLFHGIVQHSLYHAGQIAILKKASAGG